MRDDKIRAMAEQTATSRPGGLVDVTALVRRIMAEGATREEAHRMILALDKGNRPREAWGLEFFSDHKGANPLAIPGPRGLYLLDARIIEGEAWKIGRERGTMRAAPGNVGQYGKTVVHEGSTIGAGTPRAEALRRAARAALDCPAPTVQGALDCAVRAKKLLQNHADTARLALNARGISPTASFSSARSTLEEWAGTMNDSDRKKKIRLLEARGLGDAKTTDAFKPIHWQLQNALDTLPILGDPAATEAAYRRGFAAGVAKRPRLVATKKKIAKILAIEKRLHKTTGRKPDATRAELLALPDQEIADLLDRIEEIEGLADKQTRREKKEKMQSLKDYLASHGVTMPYKNSSFGIVNGKKINNLFPEGLCFKDRSGNKACVHQTPQGIYLRMDGEDVEWIGAGTADQKLTELVEGGFMIDKKKPSRKKRADAYKYMDLTVKLALEKEKAKKKAEERERKEQQKAQEKEQRAWDKKAREEAKKANAAAAKAETARKKAEEKAQKAAAKAASRDATKAEKKRAIEQARLARADARKEAQLAKRAAEQTARAARLASQEGSRLPERPGPSIPFTLDALLAAGDADANELIALAGRTQKAALSRQIRGEIKMVRIEIRKLKAAQKQRLKVIRERARDAGRSIRKRMIQLRQDFLRQWGELKAEDKQRRDSYAQDTRTVNDEIGPNMRDAAARAAKLLGLKGKLKSAKALPSPAALAAARKRVEQRQDSNDFVAYDLERSMPEAVKWWKEKGQNMAAFSPKNTPARMSRAEHVVQELGRNPEILDIFNQKKEREFLKEQEKREAELQRKFRASTTARSQRATRAVARRGFQNKRTIQARRDWYKEGAPF